MPKLIIDPPDGWRYGFPKDWNKDVYPTYEELLRASGYPEKDIEFACTYSRRWVVEDDEEG